MIEFKNMSNDELASFINDANCELTRRKNERANKLISRACEVLNELQSLGVMFFFEELNEEYGDSHNVYVFDGERTFTPDNFYMVKEIK